MTAEFLENFCTIAASHWLGNEITDKNIDELLEELNRTFPRLTQSGIDEELFDLISGFEALSTKDKCCAFSY